MKPFGKHSFKLSESGGIKLNVMCFTSFITDEPVYAVCIRI